jgi:formiminotetrahydrofolate cyclodeaminase
VAACREVASAAERLAGRSNLGLASDLVVASRLVESAAHGALENVLVNLPSLGDEAAAAALEADVRKMARSVTRLARATRAQVARRSLREPEGAALPPAAGAR